ncbi:xanthine dehydrogenase, small subunit (fragment of part 1) [Magnetospirillum sp. XM-1]|uniref:FAD binding domain-containing protein n=1 Tax=Magnetospirillum sp. XM-1 TaxID=1663591 RepID=UPI00073E02F9|nr:xanthine dehydrogenase family protein subunit M [Magnetospirillum sp. XM-1]CUW39549.1 xanthine dehydrogenase, small subunit (fragment of part 1) [Magnetospirillum sp. XM-1]
MTAIERYLAPASLDDALAALAGGNATILAGGTDLMPQSNAGKVSFRPILLNIRRIPELRAVDIAQGRITIGALTTINDLKDNPVIAKAVPLLAEAADHFASDQVRNMGTIGGNVANASPAGDTLVPLLVLDAEVELASASGRRSVPMAEFFTGPGRTVRRPDELITGFSIPLPRLRTVSRFVKFGTRPALDISAVSIGFAATLESGRLSDVRVAFGAVGPTPLRGRATEAVLEGASLDAQTIAKAAITARDEIKPIDDLRASAWYRRELVHNLLGKVLSDVVSR